MFQYLNTLEGYSDSCMFKTINLGDVVSYSYADYLKDVRTCAFLLEEAIGNVEGRHIGIIAHSDYKYLVLLAAIIFSRAVAVPINEKETDENIISAVKNADIDVIIRSEEVKKYEIENALTLERDILFNRNGKEKALMDFSDEEKDRPALIVFTSGTTSLSKGVALSVDNILHDSRNILIPRYYDNPESAKGSVVYTNFPFYHLGGMLAWLTYSGKGCTICYSADSRNALSNLESQVIDFAAVSPAVLKLWIKSLKHNRIERLGGVKDIITVGAALDPEYVAIFMSYGISLWQTYGQTETCGAVTYNFDMENHPGSIGKAIMDANISIRDGEICIEFWGNMQGYYKNPEDTKSCLKDGVVYSGDLGYIDDDGYIYITGRKKNLIILSGGENVSPEEIEGKLYENPLVQECRVYEQNDSIYADIYAPGMDEDGVKCYVKEINQSMPIYKRIKHVQYKECELEKTSIGKIKR